MRPTLVAVLAVGALAGNAPAWAQARFDFDRTPGRLTKDVVPAHYALDLDLDPARDSFRGEVVVTLRVRQPVGAIELHAEKLQAERLTLDSAGAVPRTLRAQADAAAQLWKLVPDDGAPIAAGEHRLRIAYRGPVGKSGTGLFQASAPAAVAAEAMLATQLASIHARELLPVFDEPAFRAVFELTVRAPAGYEVLGNMPLAERRADGASVVHRFAPTPPMPSYLLALAVGRFDVLEDSAAGVPLRIFTAPGKREQARYAMEVTRQVLPFYNDYFGVPYALPKLDQLAVPANRSGAMEDWGLISYAEGILLYDPARSRPLQQRIVYELVAHEVAHMWFGNLVTHASWEEIWLNEAFATWIAGKLVDRFNPHWHVTLNARAELEPVLERDAGSATRAIRSGPVSERAVYDVLDSVTYDKGGAVLSMLEQWIGPDVFQRGLASYMRERRLSNATAGDLWHHVGQAAGRDVAAVAGSWTDKPGFPLIGVSTRCVAGQTVAQLSQKRFLLNGEADNDTLWEVPLALANDQGAHASLLARRTAAITLPGCGPLVVNAGGHGFYRVDYAPAQRRELTRRFTALAPADRVALLSDRFALVQAGRVPAEEYFALLDQLPRIADGSRVPLYLSALDALEFLDRALAGTRAQAHVRSVGRKVMAPELARIGWAARAGEDPQVPGLRSRLIMQLARFDDARLVAEARRRYAEAGDGATLPAGLRSAVINVVGMDADGARFEQLRARLLEARGEEDRWLYARALTAVRDPALAGQALQLALDQRVPANIATQLPAMLARQSPHGARAYAFTQTHWTALAQRAGAMFNADAWLLAEVAQHSNDRAMIERLQRDDAATTVASRTPAARAADRIRLLADVRDREAPRLGGTSTPVQAAR